ncbi:MAG: hypothetical protein KIT09_00490 [Bryobacteraceae bacterium]|nr:hypothetical protein [Bryobacteraceae bacterium]
MARVFAKRKQTAQTDLEAVEMALRAARHRAGAAALSQLLRFPEPDEEQRVLPCSCGHKAPYRERRSRHILTALGEVEIARPWYSQPQSHRNRVRDVWRRIGWVRDIEVEVRRVGGRPSSPQTGR